MGTDLILVHGIQYKVLLGNELLLALWETVALSLLTLLLSIPMCNWTFFSSQKACTNTLWVQVKTCNQGGFCVL